MKKTCLALCVVCSVFLLSGCELYDILSDAIRDVWGSPKTVDVLVLPPLPSFDEGEESNWNQRLANCDSKSIEQAMIRGVAAFNDGTRSTQIIARYYQDKEDVKLFYEEVVLGVSHKSKRDGSDAAAALRQSLREFLHMLNQDKKSDGSRNNYKCLICGFYKFNRNASANNITLLHYDKEKDAITVENGIVTKEEGLAQDTDLQQLMTTLLKKAYGR